MGDQHRVKIVVRDVRGTYSPGLQKQLQQVCQNGRRFGSVLAETRDEHLQKIMPGVRETMLPASTTPGEDCLRYGLFLGTAAQFAIAHWTNHPKRHYHEECVRAAYTCAVMSQQLLTQALLLLPPSARRMVMERCDFAFNRWECLKWLNGAMNAARAVCALVTLDCDVWFGTIAEDRDDRIDLIASHPDLQVNLSIQVQTSYGNIKWTLLREKPDGIHLNKQESRDFIALWNAAVRKRMNGKSFVPIVVGVAAGNIQPWILDHNTLNLEFREVFLHLQKSYPPSAPPSNG